MPTVKQPKQIEQWLVAGRTVLIPKEGCGGKPHQYRLITCSNTIYKLMTRLGLSTSPYQLPSIKNPSSSSSKFVTMNQCSDQLAFYSCLKTKKWRKLEQHSIENHNHIAQWVVQLTCIQKVAGSNPVGEQVFLKYQYVLQTRFFRIQL